MTYCQLACLYTGHKSQKRKVWQDGRLVVRGSVVMLHAAEVVPGSSDPILDQCEVTAAEASSINAGHISDLEMDKFLVTIEGPWVSTQKTAAKVFDAPASSSMQKLLTKKYRKPTQQIPPPRSSSTSMQENIRKRQRPLQPGELQRKYYGHVESKSESNGTRLLSPSFLDHANATGDFGKVNVDIPAPGLRQAFLPHSIGQNTNEQHLASLPTIRFENSVPSNDPSIGLRPSSPLHQSAQYVAKQSHRVNHSTLISDSGDYDPSNFYGEEEEEEEEQDSDNESSEELFQIPNSNGEILPSPKENNLFRMPQAHLETESSQNPQEDRKSYNNEPHKCTMIPIDKTVVQAETTERHGSTLSTSQLLNLFGGCDPTGPPDSTSPERPSIDTGTQPNLTINETTNLACADQDLQKEDDFQLPSDDSSDEED